MLFDVARMSVMARCAATPSICEWPNMSSPPARPWPRRPSTRLWRAPGSRPPRCPRESWSTRTARQAADLIRQAAESTPPPRPDQAAGLLPRGRPADLLFLEFPGCRWPHGGGGARDGNQSFAHSHSETRLDGHIAHPGKCDGRFQPVRVRSYFGKFILNSPTIERFTMSPKMCC